MRGDAPPSRCQHVLLLPEEAVGRGDGGRLEPDALARPDLPGERKISGDYLPEHGIAPDRLGVSK